jgi:hypothetical protein
MTENYPDSLFEEAARREAALKAVEKLYEENGEGLQRLAEIERKELIEEND